MKRHITALSLMALLLATGCTSTASFLQPASLIARQEADSFRLLMALSVVVFVIVEGLLLYNVTQHKKEDAPQGIPPQEYRQYLVEATYTGIPIIIVIVLFILMTRTMRAVAAPEPQSTDLKLQIIGHQWWWEFDYPDQNIRTANELHIPVDTTVQIDLNSYDVIHSFWVPQLSGKTDVVPGVTNHMWLRGDTPGKYYGQCSEFCGLNHANMRITVFVDSAADFQAWVANQQQPPTDPTTDLQKQGQDTTINGVCSACHDLGDNGPQNAIGPNLTHLMSRTTFAGGMYPLNQDNLHRWLEDTQAMKPGNHMDHKFSEQEIDALMAYLTTLK